MIWWCKARALPLVVVATLGTLLAGLVVGDVELPVPVLTGQSGQFLLAHLMTLIPAATLLYGFSRSDGAGGNTAVRPIRSWDTALGLLTAAAGATCAAICHFVLGSDLALVIGRNQAGYIGLGLLLSPLLGAQLAAATIAAIPLTLAAGGWRPNGAPESWAWLLHDAGSTSALLITLGLLGVGSLMSMAWTHPPVRPGAAA